MLNIYDYNTQKLELLMIKNILVKHLEMLIIRLIWIHLDENVNVFYVKSSEHFIRF